MNKCEFNATNLIAETFEKRGVKFDVVITMAANSCWLAFPLTAGPT